MPKLKIGEDCCGCTACAAICGKKAISMVPDSLGFKYPVVNPDLCVECGLCERVCAFNEEYNTDDKNDTPIPYGIRLKEEEEVMKSRSGGAFVAFSDWVLNKNGVVYGVGFSGHFVVTHKRATSQSERDEFRGSKYVQSNLDGIFAQVKADLTDDKWVLFSGTGCQVAGLNSYIPKSLKAKLITVDIVCHGVPSPKIWADYIRYIENKEKKVVVGVDFRNKKDFGWQAHKETFILKEPLTTTTTTTNTYTYVFYQHIMQRPSCGICYFCNTRRPADLTLADFWGWENTDCEINKDNKGLSLVLVNSKKGENVFSDVKSRFNMIHPKLEDCMQSHLKEPKKPNKSDSKFKMDYEKHGFEYVMKKYGNIGLRYKIKRIPYKAISLLKRFIIG